MRLTWDSGDGSVCISTKHRATWVGEEEFMWLTSYISLAKETKAGTQGRNLEARTEAENMRQCCSLTCHHGLLSQLSYTIQDHLSRGGNNHNGLDPPVSVINEENDPQGCSHSNLMEVILHLKFPFPGNSSMCQIGKSNKRWEEI